MFKKTALNLLIFAAPLFTWSNEGHAAGRDILSAEDLTEEAQTTTDGSSSWQCFDKKYLQYSCSYVRPLDKQGSSLGIEIALKSGSHFYSHSHAISGEVCKQMLLDLIKILRDNQQFCILGTLDEVRKIKGRKESSWSFYRLKTKSGYVHYRLPERSQRQSTI